MVIEGAARSPRARPVSAWRQVDRSDVDALLRTYQEATERRRRDHPQRYDPFAIPSDDLPPVDVSTWSVEPEVLALIPRSFAEEHLLLPLQRTEGCLQVASTEEDQSSVLAELEAMTGLRVEVITASALVIRDAISRNYGPLPPAPEGPQA